MGELLGMESPHISLAAEGLFRLGPLVVTNSMLMMLISMLVVFGFFRWTANRTKLMPTSRLQLLGEWIIEALLGLVQSVAGERLGRRIFPLIGSLFIFILVANWLGLLPGVGTIGFYESHAEPVVAEAPAAPKDAAHPPAEKVADEHEGTDEHAGPVFVPFLRAANADLNMTLAMAIIAVTTIQLIGVRAHGVGGYLKELATPPFLFPVHVISELSRILSLSARLFGNIFGGEVFLFVIFFLFPVIIPLIPIGLEIFFGFIQAVLFSVLTLVYVSMAAAGHGGHGEEHEHAEHGATEMAPAGTAH